MMIDITLDPTLVAFGPIVVGWHGILTMLAVAVALWYGTHRAERAGLDMAVIERAVTVAIAGRIYRRPRLPRAGSSGLLLTKSL